MIRYGVLIVAIAVASSFAMPQIDRGTSRLLDLVTAAVDYVEAMNIQADPLNNINFKLSPQNPELDGKIKADLTINNGSLYGFSKLQVSGLITDPDRGLIMIALMAPEITFAGDYNVDGVMFGDKVTGRGQFLLKAKGLNVSLDNVRLVECKNKTLRIQSLGLSVNVDDMPIMVTGLSDSDRSVPNFEDYMNSNLQTEINSYARRTLKGVETSYIVELNRAIGDRTIDELIQHLANNQPKTSDAFRDVIARIINEAVPA